MLNNAIIEDIKSLPSNFWDFKKHDTRDNSHGIHFYPATMIYPISKSIIKLMLKHRQVTSFLDPFMGSGTTLVEARLNGIPSIYGTDLNPLADLLTNVKTTNLTNEQLKEAKKFAETISSVFDEWDEVIKAFDKYIRDELKLDVTHKFGWADNAHKYVDEFCKRHNIKFVNFRVFKNMGFWFLPKVVFSLQLIKQELTKIEDEKLKKFLLVAFSETVRLASNTRNSEFKLFRMQAEKVAVFDPDVRREFIRILNHNISKIVKFNELCESRQVDTSICLDDTRVLKSVPDNSIDLVVTSPPYGDSKTTVAYGQYSRLALQWLDLDISEDEILQLDNRLLGGKPYIDKQQWALLGSKTLEELLARIAEKDLFRADDVFSFYVDLDKCLYAISKKTRIDGYHFWVVGNRTVKLEKVHTDQILIELAQKHGLEFVYNFGRAISNKVMPQRNSPTNKNGATVETMTKEHIVVFRKVA